MRCDEIIKKLEALAPEYLASSWDNVGLLLGERKKAVKTIVIGLEMDEALIDMAVKNEADMIITHHPMLFHPFRVITDEDATGRRIMKILQNKICYYAMHTNFDACEEGMAALAAERLNLCGVKVLDEEKEYTDAAGSSQTAGIGRIGRLPAAITLRKLCDKIKKTFGNQMLTVYAGESDMEKMLEKVAVVPGAGKDYAQAALEQGAEVLITGDLNHHAGIDAYADGLIVIDAGHYRTEQIFISFMEEYLNKTLDKDVILLAAPVKDPFQFV